jgi:hypothetical protein
MADMLSMPLLKVLEPTPGKGNLVNALKERGHLVTAPVDFFLLSKTKTFDAVVLNPPFSSRYTDMTNAPMELNKSGMFVGYWILKECMQKADEIIALMPQFVLGDSDVRVRAFCNYGLKSVTFLPRKTFNYARIQTIILHLQRGYNGITETKFLHVNKNP